MTNIVWAKIYLSTKTNVLCAKRVKKTGRHLCFWPVLFYFFIIPDALCCYEDDGSQETSQARREVVWWLKLGKLGIPFQPKRGDTTKQPATQVIAVWISWFFLVQFYWIININGHFFIYFYFHINRRNIWYCFFISISVFSRLKRSIGFYIYNLGFYMNQMI